MKTLGVVRYVAAALTAVLTVAAAPVLGQEPGVAPPDRDAALAVAHAALEAINREDMTAFAELMIPEAVMVSVLGDDGEGGYRVRTRNEARSLPMEGDVVERGFDPVVRVAGGVALVWLPYDLYVDDEWSHCGVDAFTLVRTADGWRIAAIAYTIQQPPACGRHPHGPPDGDAR